MAITVKHTFVSAKGDGSDATLVRPSNWNANHDIELATNRIIGRLTAGPGDAEELPVTSFMVGLLNTADIAALAVALGLPTTGDALLTFKTVATSGWILMNDGSIGDATSGATTLAHVSTQALFVLLYNNMNDANAPIQTSAGAGTTRAAQGTATTAYGAHCRLVLSKQLGRAIIVGGAGAGLTARTLGGIGGEEAHALALIETPNHSHNFSGSGSATGSAFGTSAGSGTTSTVSADHVHTVTVAGTSGAADRGLDHLHGFSGGTGGMNRSNPHSHPISTSTFNSTTGGGSFFCGGQIQSTSTGNTDINHEHGFSGSTGGMDRSIDHLHGTGGSGTTGGISANHTHTVNVSGSCSISSMTLSVSVSGTTAGINAAGSDGAHNNMQPFTTWNVMIKL